MEGKWDLKYANNFSLGPTDCKIMCKNNCNCKAYTSTSSGETGCKFSCGQNIDNPSVIEAFYIQNSTAQKGSPIHKGKNYKVVTRIV